MSGIRSSSQAGHKTTLPDTVDASPKYLSQEKGNHVTEVADLKSDGNCHGLDRYGSYHRY
jgi:hypothetical protein